MEQPIICYTDKSCSKQLGAMEFSDIIDIYLSCRREKKQSRKSKILKHLKIIKTKKEIVNLNSKIYSGENVLSCHHAIIHKQKHFETDRKQFYLLLLYNST